MKRILYLLIFGFLLHGSLQAQQYPLFTNYIMNSFGFNPGVAGSTDYIDARLTYRTQWTQLEDAPQTAIMSAQGRLKKLPIGIGGYVFNDVAGALKRTGGSAVVSYSQLFGEQHRISVGASVGYYNLRLNNRESLANSMDPTLMAAGDGLNIPDFNVGIHYQHKSGFYAGLSSPQILKGDLKFNDAAVTDVKSELIRHYYLMAGYNYKLNEKIQLQPSVLLKVADLAPTQYDISLVATFHQRFWVGASYRSEDAVALMLGYDINKALTLAYAYDLTTSSLKHGSSGSHEITLGFRLGMTKDRDEDGIPDDKDKCPDEPGPPENEGCPEDPIAAVDDDNGDNDKDGILNKDDKCPDQAGPAENEGCPWGDKDNDGIRDDIDKCADVFGLASNEGCPLTDRDKDGIVDNKDKCPDEYGELRYEGCPHAIAAVQDRDGDGILDAIDKCPDLAGVQANEGCPRIDPADQRILDLAIQNVYFDTNKDEIRREGFPYLDRLAELMISKRELKIRLSGHADSRGSSAHNLELSKRRSESVMFYLLNRGLRRSQLDVEYYGEELPAAANVSEESRQRNRRVEMEFVWD